MSQPAISVQNLSKAYQIGLRQEAPDTLVAAVSRFLKAPLRNLQQLRRLDTSRMDHGDRGFFWALQDVCLEVNQGEVLGVIGRNGAGKSTLLKILSRITEPTRGRAVIRGRVSSLLEVGTGFHPELSGRENIYLNGTILGMTKVEIDRKFDAIVDFSGVEKFLDTPLKRYSSGMKVRLAFAVAAHLEPEVLIIDEVLAVGDAEFQKKCLGKMRDVAQGGRTVVFVSHDMPAVRSLTTVSAYLEKGRVLRFGQTPEIIDCYLKDAVNKATEGSRDVSYFRRDLNESSDAVFTKVWVGEQPQDSLPVIESGAKVVLNMELLAKKPMSNLSLALTLTKDGQHTVTSFCSADFEQPIDLESGITRWRCTIGSLALSPGRYSATLGITQNERVRALDVLNDVPLFEVKLEDALVARLTWPSRPWGVLRCTDVSWSMVDN